MKALLVEISDTYLNLWSDLNLHAALKCFGIHCFLDYPYKTHIMSACTDRKFKQRQSNGEKTQIWHLPSSSGSIVSFIFLHHGSAIVSILVFFLCPFYTCSYAYIWFNYDCRWTLTTHIHIKRWTNVLRGRSKERKMKNKMWINRKEFSQMLIIGRIQRVTLFVLTNTERKCYGRIKTSEKLDFIGILYNDNSYFVFFYTIWFLICFVVIFSFLNSFCHITHQTDELMYFDDLVFVFVFPSLFLDCFLDALLFFITIMLNAAKSKRKTKTKVRE